MELKLTCDLQVMVQLTLKTDMFSCISWDPVQDQFPVHNNNAYLLEQQVSALHNEEGCIITTVSKCRMTQGIQIF